MNKTLTKLNPNPTLRNNEASLTPSSTPYNYLHAATSDNTRKAYQADIRHFEAWGGKLPTSSEQLIAYLHAFAEQLNPRTLARHITALKQWHCYQGFVDPTQYPSVKKTLSGIKRIHGKPREKAAPLLPEELEQIVLCLEPQTTLTAYRDNALLQIGFFAALRRSELANICYEDLDFQTQGVEIFIPQSKTDQERQGQYSAVPYGKSTLCPVKALEQWLLHSEITKGPVFRKINRWDQLGDSPLTPVAINVLIKKNAMAAGIEHAAQLSGHSLRRGLASAAARKGANISAIMRQGRWKQVNTVMEYIEAVERFNENAADVILNKSETTAD